MDYEVERKFRLPSVDEFLHRAKQAHLEFGPIVTQIDHYYGHPSRDFGQTDEALRVRAYNRQCRVTYKGPKVSATTKTRREIELPFADEVTDPDQVAELFLALGFRSVAKVTKRRRSAQITQADWQFSVDLDQVEDVGDFVELDVIADESQIACAEAAMSKVADELALTDEVRASYLEMLLEIRAG